MLVVFRCSKNVCKVVVPFVVVPAGQHKSLAVLEDRVDHLNFVPGSSVWSVFESPSDFRVCGRVPCCFVSQIIRRRAGPVRIARNSFKQCVSDY